LVWKVIFGFLKFEVDWLWGLFWTCYWFSWACTLFCLIQAQAIGLISFQVGNVLVFRSTSWVFSGSLGSDLFHGFRFGVAVLVSPPLALLVLAAFLGFVGPGGSSLVISGVAIEFLLRPMLSSSGASWFDRCGLVRLLGDAAVCWGGAFVSSLVGSRWVLLWVVFLGFCWFCLVD